jgi:hypothetical protein
VLGKYKSSEGAWFKLLQGATSSQHAQHNFPLCSSKELVKLGTPLMWTYSGLSCPLAVLHTCLPSLPPRHLMWPRRGWGIKPIGLSNRLIDGHMVLPWSIHRWGMVWDVSDTNGWYLMSCQGPSISLASCAHFAKQGGSRMESHLVKLTP